MEFNDQQFILSYSTTTKTFSIKDVGLLKSTEWNLNTFEEFRDGERVECSVNGENVVLLQSAGEEEFLTESLNFCEAAKKKRMTISKIQGYLRPVRGIRRQSLPPVDVSFITVISL